MLPRFAPSLDSFVLTVGIKVECVHGSSDYLRIEAGHLGICNCRVYRADVGQNLGCLGCHVGALFDTSDNRVTVTH